MNINNSYYKEKDVTVYIKDSFFNFRNINNECYIDKFIKEAADNFNITTDLEVYRRPHDVDKFFTILFCYQKINDLNFYLN